MALSVVYSLVEESDHSQQMGMAKTAERDGSRPDEERRLVRAARCRGGCS